MYLTRTVLKEYPAESWFTIALLIADIQVWMVCMYLCVVVSSEILIRSFGSPDMENICH